MEYGSRNFLQISCNSILNTIYLQGICRKSAGMEAGIQQEISLIEAYVILILKNVILNPTNG